MLQDCGSTNGTYIQLVGPYKGRHKLSLNDHILVGRTGFSIHRYDFGVAEEKGHRQTMEDSCTIAQHLNMQNFNLQKLSPQSFFGVFDGHGGSEASAYLSQHLHTNVANGLMDVAEDILQIFIENIEMETREENSKESDEKYDREDMKYDSNEFESVSMKNDRRNYSQLRADDIVKKSIKCSFLETDEGFLSTSANPRHGSTATTALILGEISSSFLHIF